MLCRTYGSLRSAFLLLLLASAVRVPSALAQASAFSPTGSLAVARDTHTATLLPNGKVLIAGGFRIDPVSHELVYLTSAELFDPAAGTFSATGNLATGRAGHTATLLPNGKVLITGGANFNVATGFVRSAELYDPPAGRFFPVGDFAAGRRYHTATLLPNGKVLIAGGFGSVSSTTLDYVRSAELYDPTSGTIAPSGNLAAPRKEHTATLLPNGKVLIAGGGNCAGPACSSGSLALTSAELYDPATGLFTPTGNLLTARNQHTATLLQNGRVLIAGGKGSDNRALSPAVGPAELYDPASGTFSSTGSLAVLRLAHTATLLPNGNVLIAGGYNPDAYAGVLASAELYDPAAGSFSAIGSLGSAREEHTATLLQNGKVLITAGLSSGYLSSAELYDPLFVNANQPSPFLTAGSLATARYGHAATLLQNGRVLLSGGTNVNAGVLSSAELYDPATGNVFPTGSLTTARYYHTATLLQNGKVLMTGSYTSSGGSLSSAELYDPAAGTFFSTGSLGAARDTHTATLLQNGKVLVVGGFKLASAELYDPQAGTFSATGSLAVARFGHTATLLTNGKVLITGGSNSTDIVASAELYDPAGSTFSATGSLAVPRFGHTATLLPNGKVLIVGGTNATGALASAELYDPAAGTFSPAGTLAVARVFHTATRLPGGKVLVAGGAATDGRALSSVELYDPSTAAFSPGGNLATARDTHTETLLQNGKVIIAGGHNSDSESLASVELYDPLRRRRAAAH